MTEQQNFAFDVFISYARKDGLVTGQQLETDLRDRGLRAFLDQHQIDRGEEWWERFVVGIVKWFPNLP